MILDTASASTDLLVHKIRLGAILKQMPSSRSVQPKLTV